MIIQPEKEVILASASPRRREILEKMGLKFRVVPSHINEHFDASNSPENIAMQLSADKAQSIAVKYPDAIIIGSDTVVVYKDHILGKPKDEDDAFRMLKMLSGQTHFVISAYCIIIKEADLDLRSFDRTDVEFRSLSEEEIKNYIYNKSPADKAGAYGIQDLSANLVRRINGDYFNVTGFPAAEFSEKWNSLFHI